jgi:hypothetical protein
MGGVAVVLTALNLTAQRKPHIRWLRHFDFSRNLTPKQKQRLQRSLNRTAGVEMILLGFAMPIGYVVLTVVFFNAIEPAPMIIASILGLVCAGLGVTAIYKAGR